MASWLRAAGSQATSLARAYMLDKTNGANVLTIAVGHSPDILNFSLGEFADLSAVSDLRRPLITIEETGEQIPAGGAKLNVQLQEPAYDAQTGAPTYSHSAGEHVDNVNGYRTLRDVVYGGSFEGYTTFGLGVRARLPFRVFTLAGPGTHSRLVIDVAHQWSQ